MDTVTKFIVGVVLFLFGSVALMASYSFFWILTFKKWADWERKKEMNKK